MTRPNHDLAARLAQARVYLLATSHVAKAPLIEAVEGALRGGVEIVQLREKEMPDDDFALLAEELRDLTSRYDALLIVNDRILPTIWSCAHGIHLGQGDAPPQEARSALPPGSLVGISTHDENELARALDDGADYVGVGSVFPTSTKTGDVPVSGPEALAPLAAAAEAVGVPAFAIGGITPGNVDEVAAAGFLRVAVCAGILAARSPEAAAREIRARLKTM